MKRSSIQKHSTYIYVSSNYGQRSLSVGLQSSTFLSHTIVSQACEAMPRKNITVFFPLFIFHSQEWKSNLQITSRPKVCLFFSLRVNQNKSNYFSLALNITTRGPIKQKRDGRRRKIIWSDDFLFKHKIVFPAIKIIDFMTNGDNRVMYQNNRLQCLFSSILFLFRTNFFSFFFHLIVPTKYHERKIWWQPV